MIRVGVVIAVAAAVVSLTAACDPLGRPRLMPAFGARVTDGQLHIWTGSQCHGVTELGLEFDPYQEDRAEWLLNAPDEAGADVEYFTLGEPVPGLKVTKQLPTGFDWRSAESVQINVDGAQPGWGTTTQLADVIKDSVAHPDDTYWFQEAGWLNPAEVTDQDGKTFLATCTPSPAN